MMRFKIPLLVLFLALLVSLIIWQRSIFSLDKLDIVSSADCVSEKDLTSELQSLNYFWILFNADRLKQSLSAKYLCIREIEIDYHFPKTVKLTIYGRQFLARLISENITLYLPDVKTQLASETALIDWSLPKISSETPYLIDNNGFIFAKKTIEENMPLLFSAENISLGKQMDRESFQKVAQILDKYARIEPMLSQAGLKAKIFENTFLISSPMKLAFSLERDILKQLASLQLILQKAKIDEKTIEIIDLRFDKPVVIYRPKSSNKFE